MGVTGSFPNAKAATARERREAQRQPARAEAKEEQSDIRDLMKGLVPETQAEGTRKERTHAVQGKDGRAHLPEGFFGRKLPQSLNEQIDNDRGPNGDLLRQARDEGRIYRDVASNKFVVEGVAPVASSRTASGGHLDPGYYRNSPTVRRNQEMRR